MSPECVIWVIILREWLQFDIVVNIAVSEQSIIVDLSYWTTSLGDGLVSRIASTLRQTVQEIVGQPNSTVSDLDIMSGDDRQQIYTWNRTVPAKVDRCVHTLVEERC